MEWKDPRKNCEGYLDLTHHEAVKNIEKERKEKERFNQFLRTIFYISDAAGFKIKNRMVIEDKKTGRIWK